MKIIKSFLLVLLSISTFAQELDNSLVALSVYKSLLDSRSLDKSVPEYINSINTNLVSENIYSNHLYNIFNVNKDLDSIKELANKLDNIVNSITNPSTRSTISFPRANSWWDRFRLALNWSRNDVTVYKNRGCTVRMDGPTYIDRWDGSRYKRGSIGYPGPQYGWYLNGSQENLEGSFYCYWVDIWEHPCDSAPFWVMVEGMGQATVAFRSRSTGFYRKDGKITGTFYKSTSATGSASAGEYMRFSGYSRSGSIHYNGNSTIPNNMLQKPWRCQCPKTCTECNDRECGDMCPCEANPANKNPNSPFYKKPKPPDPPKHECDCGEDAECCDGNCEDCHCKECICECESCQNGDCSGCTHIDCNPEEEHCECGACTCDKCPDCYGDYNCCNCSVCHLRNCNKGKKIGFIIIAGGHNIGTEKDPNWVRNNAIENSINDIVRIALSLNPYKIKLFRDLTYVDGSFNIPQVIDFVKDLDLINMIYIGHGANNDNYPYYIGSSVHSIIYPNDMARLLKRYNDKCSLVFINSSCFSGKKRMIDYDKVLVIDASNGTTSESYDGSIFNTSVGFIQRLRNNYYNSISISDLFNKLRSGYYNGIFSVASPKLRSSGFNLSNIKLFHPQPSIDIENSK